MRSKRDVVVHHHRQTVVDKYIQNEYAIHAEAWKLALFVIQNCVRVKTKIKNSLSSTTTHHHDIKAPPGQFGTSKCPDASRFYYFEKILFCWLINTKQPL
jgi:hypothetical protein